MKSTEIIQPTPLIAPIAASGLRNNIPDDATGSNYASIEEGFPEMTMKAPIDGGLPPWGQDFNGMFYLMSSQTCFLQNGGNITFNQAVSDKIGGYPQGAVLDYIDENGTFSKVRSLIDDNTYNFVTTPSYIDNVHWEQIGMTAATSWGNIGGNIENQSDLQAALGERLSDTQVTNCILSSTNANITNNSVSDASYVNQGCTVSEANVVSGFSADNYILLSKTMTSANAFTLEIPFTTGSNVTADQTLVYINNFSNSLGISGGKIVLRYDGNVLSGTTTLAASTAYVALLTRTASNYTVQIKTASGAYGDAEITLPSTAGYFGGKSVYLGGGDANYFQGSVDLANLVIQENASNYWTYTTLSDFQTVTVSGTYQLLMPNGRNADKTLNNVTKSVTLNDTLLYSPANGEKTVLVKEDGELMIRDYYAETYNQPADVPLNGVWMNKTANTLTEQLNTYPNFINTGVTIASNGNVTGFNATAFVQLPNSYELGKNWELKIRAGVDAINGSCLAYVPDENSTSGFRAFKITSAPESGGGTTAQVTAQFRRDDVYIVNREITVSTAYEVTKTDTSGDEPTTVTGYVQTAGEAESYVTAGTQVYSDSGFQTPLEQAAEDTWTYTGETVANTEVQTGYTKTGGVTLVPVSTVVYSDANCTSVQATASGTDYTYSGDTAESIICSITDTITTADDTVTIGSNGAQFYLNDQTYSSTDTVQDNVTVVLGSDGEDFVENLWLDDTYLSISDNFAWQWNGVSSSTQDFVPFVGAKLGKVTDDGTTITAMELDMPLTLAKDTDVVHNTGNEYIEGVKTFKNLIEITGQGLLVKHESLNSRDNQYPYIHLNNPHAAVDIEEENLAEGQSFGRFAMVDTTGKIIGGMSLTTATNAAINTPTLAVETSRFYNGERQSSNLKLSFNAKGETTFEFPCCTSTPTTTRSAENNRTSTVVRNYLSGTSGFIVFSDNLKIQWGASIIETGTKVHVTLLLPFQSNNYYINPRAATTSSSTTANQILTPYALTPNSFKVQGNGQMSFRWFAIGY